MGRRRSDPAASTGYYIQVQEIADQNLVGGASITPTVDGLFSAAEPAGFLRCELWCDATPGWIIHSGGAGAPLVIVSGQANLIRYRNTDALAHDVVILREY